MIKNLCALISSNYTKLKVRVIKKLDGISSTNVYVTIGNKGYVAKIISPGNEKLIYKICYVSRLLKANAIPAPSILPTIDGKECVTNNEFSFVLFEKLPGKILHEFDFQAKSLISTAAMLSKIHNIKLCVTNNTSYINMSASSILQNPIGGCKILKAKKDEMEIIHSITKEKEKLLSRIISLCKNDSINIEDVVITNFIHGDFHNQNILFNKEHMVTGVLDFESFSIGDGLLDVYQFILLGCCNTGFSKKHLMCAQIFAKAYVNSCPKTFEQLRIGLYRYLLRFCYSSFIEQQYINTKEKFLENIIVRDIKMAKYFMEFTEPFLQKVFGAQL
jgi:Ser/Thr protein kinase RdoA (MazF antagonist)